MPEQIRRYDDFVKIIPTVDIINSSAAFIQDEVITVRTDGKWQFQPVFTNAPLIAGESYEVKILDFADGDFMVGVGTAYLRNRAQQFDHNNSMCILAHNGKLYSDGNQHKCNFRLKANENVTIRHT